MVRCVALIQFSDGLLLDMEWFHYNTLSQVKSGFLVISVFILDFGMQTVDLGPSKEERHLLPLWGNQSGEATGGSFGEVPGVRGGRGDKPAVWEIVAYPHARQRLAAVHSWPGC